MDGTKTMALMNRENDPLIGQDKSSEDAPPNTAALPDLAIEQVVTRVTGAVVVFLLAAMTLVIWTSVFTRYVVGDPIQWGEQAAKYLMIWAAFLAASLGLREGSHIAVNILVDLLPRPVRKVCAATVIALCAVFLGVCIVYGTMFAYGVRLHTDPLVGEMSMSFAYAAIPVGCFFMLLQLGFIARHGLDRTLSQGTASLS